MSQTRDMGHPTLVIGQTWATRRATYPLLQRRRVEVCGLPLIHDKTVDEWGTEVLGYFMTGPPAVFIRAGMGGVEARRQRTAGRGSSFPPFHKKRGRMGHPALWDGQDFKNLGCATRQLSLLVKGGPPAVPHFRG
jgi:hypothetical protein